MILSKVSSEVSLKNIGSRGLDSIHDESLKNIGISGLGSIHTLLRSTVVQCSKREESCDRKQQATSFGLYLDNTKQLRLCHQFNAIFDEPTVVFPAKNNYHRPPRHSCRASSGRASGEF